LAYVKGIRSTEEHAEPPVGIVNCAAGPARLASSSASLPQGGQSW
jgi:hypothetical protein